MGELCEWLRTEAASGGAAGVSYDLVLAADVLVYLGNLAPVFACVRSVAAPGALFAFSTEADLLAEAADGTTASAAPEAAAGEGGRAQASFRLTGTGRCVHARSYVLALASETGFTVASVTRTAIRRNAGADVFGDIFVLRKRET